MVVVVVVMVVVVVVGECKRLIRAIELGST